MEGADKRYERLLDAVRSNRKNCRYEDIERLLVYLGFTVRGEATSHRIFTKGSQRVVIPKRRPVKEHYVREVLQAIGED